MKAYLYRHQHAGIVTSHVFTERPSDEQLAPLKAEAERLHGRDGWSAIHEIDVVGPGELPFVPPAPGSAGDGDGATVPPFSVDGTGTITSAG